jgi:hypothetical protein
LNSKLDVKPGRRAHALKSSLDDPVFSDLMMMMMMSGDAIMGAMVRQCIVNI